MAESEQKPGEDSYDDVIEELLDETSEGDLGEKNENKDLNEKRPNKTSVGVEYIYSYNVEEEPVSDILSRWGLSELCTLFADRQIDSDCLEFITVSDIDKLIPLEMMGLRIKFKARLAEWRSLKSLPLTSISENLSADSSSTVSLTSDVMGMLPKVLRSDSENSLNHEPQYMNIQQILKSNSRGKLLLSKTTPFSFSERKDLISLIIDFAVFNDFKLDTKQINSLAEEVVKLFPFETKNSYYLASGSGGRARGQLYSYYHNTIKKLRLKGILSSRSKHRACSNSSSSSPSSPSYASPPDDTQSLNEKDWLKYNSQPLELIVVKWKKSFHIRRAEILRKSADEIFNDWPLFTQSIGLYLIDLDFISLFDEEKSISLKKKWTCFQRTLLETVEEQIGSASKPVKNLLTQINAADDQNYKDLLTFKLLHYKLNPTNKISLGSGKILYLSIQDSINSNIIETENQADILIKYREVKASNKDLNLNIQPMLVASHNMFYLISDNIFHVADSFLSALDSIFKLFYVFDLKYPLQSQSVWLFIENFFFDLNSSCLSSSTATLINELKIKQNQDSSP